MESKIRYHNSPTLALGPPGCLRVIEDVIALLYISLGVTRSWNTRLGHAGLPTTSREYRTRAVMASRLPRNW